VLSTDFRPGWCGASCGSGTNGAGARDSEISRRISRGPAREVRHAPSSPSYRHLPDRAVVRHVRHRGRRRLSLLPGADEELVSAPGSAIVAYCATAGDSLYLFGEQQATNELATWWNPGGVGQATINDSTNAIDLDGTIPVTAVIVVRVDAGSNIVTYTVTESYNSSAGTCSFTGQVTNSNG
jgi:hypothetical protein